jgi:6-methylsalicylic acid synthase
MINTTSQIEADPLQDSQTVTSVDVAKIQERLPTLLSNTFSIDYLARVEVLEMGFPWQVLEHFEKEGEMLARVHADPKANPSKHWAGSSWASILNAATSISSTIFYKEPLLRMPTAIDSVTLSANTTTSKLSYVSVKRAVGDYAVDVLIFDDAGTILVDIKSLRFAGIEGSASFRTADPGLVYRIAWPPAQLAESPLRFRKVLFLAVKSPLLNGYRAQLSATGIETRIVAALKDISEIEENTIVIYIASGAECLAEVYPTSSNNCKMLLGIVKKIMTMCSKKRVFCITQDASMGSDSSALSQAPLTELARIMQSEAPDVDVEDNVFPMQAIKYVQGVDVIRVEDTVSRNARLRPFVEDTVASKLGRKQSSFHTRPQGTYVITGGLGALGLKVAFWLVEKGAKRLVLVSRRKLPARRSWDSHRADTDVQRILLLEAMNVSIFTLAVDMTSTNASSQLQSGLERLSLPPVLSVIHAADTLANQTIAATTSQAFGSVIAPKILDAIALHELFPPKTLNFMVLFSSCGQLPEFPGQAAYASGNAFLDTMATHRRSREDNTISVMWTSWRGLGMAASTKYIDAELHARDVTDVTKEEAFCAWEQIFKHDTDHAVALRPLPIDSDDHSPHPILNDCLIRRPKSLVDLQTRKEVIVEPTGGAELEAFLKKKVIQCVTSTLSLSEEFIDPHVALLELGMNSVMTVELRGRLQKSIETKVGPTLIWNCPTVSHLAQHFVDEKSR